MQKYRNIKTKAKGITYDSRKELKRHKELMLLENAGVIKDLQRQVKFLLVPAQYEVVGYTKTGKEKRKCVEREVTYIADFVYEQDGELVVEDVKSEITKKEPLYIVKRKLMRYVHGITIREV